MAIQDLRTRVGTLGAEVAKFGIIGLIGAVIDLGLFNILHHNGVGPLTSKALSTLVAAVFAFAGNRWWSFSHRARTGLRRELPLFLMLNVVGLGIAEICLGFTYYVLDLRGPIATNISVGVIGLGLGTLFRFWAYKRWVFRHPDLVAGLDHDDLIEDQLESVIQL